jgi:hypothetical protein
VKAKDNVDAPTLIAEFNGRQFYGRKVTADRVHRYLSYCRNQGILKTILIMVCPFRVLDMRSSMLQNQHT